MSVINKMLRDLDKRSAAAVANQGPTGIGALRKGTSSVDHFGPESGSRGRRVLIWAAAVGLLLAAAAGVFWWTHMQPDADAPQAVSNLASPAQPVAQPAPPAAAVASAPVLLPAPDAAVLASLAQPDLGAVQAPPAVPAIPVAPVALAAPAAPVAANVPVAPATAASSNTPAVPARSTASGPFTGASAPAQPPAKPAVLAAPVAPAIQATPTAKAPASAIAIDPVQLAQRQQQLGREALAHAQTLWNSGSRDLAIDLLQQAETAAERASQTNLTPSNIQHQATLVRELVRMLLAQGRASAALDLLVRVEPQLRGEADIWATRANVAQRLGRHQDSVQAYTVALQSRPTEQRWLLGTAVSLAALGQTAQATEMAEKARLVGPITKEVQTYLRQMGVNLKDQ